MASSVFQVEKIQLQDEEGNPGREITVTSLPIKSLREFQEEFKKMSTVESEDEGLEILFNCAVIAVTARNKDVTREELEESMDIVTMMKVLEVAGGVVLDPNQMNPQPKV